MPVSELAVAGSVLGHLQFNDLMESNGHWFFVGSVDRHLAYETKDGKEPADEQIDAAQSVGPELAGLQKKTWPTKEAALEALGKISPETKPEPPKVHQPTLLPGQKNLRLRCKAS